MKLCTAPCSSSLAAHQNDLGVLLITLVLRAHPRNRVQASDTPVPVTTPNTPVPVTTPSLPKGAHLPRASSSGQTHSASSLPHKTPGVWAVTGEGVPGQTRRLPPGRLLMLRTLIRLPLAKFFERKKANKKTHNSKGTQLIFFFTHLN